MADHESIQELAAALVAELTAAGKSVATAESCTGGWIAKAITDIPGSSAMFAYGIVSYSNGAKESMLGVQNETLEEHGAVSEPSSKRWPTGAAPERRGYRRRGQRRCRAGWRHDGQARRNGLVRVGRRDGASRSIQSAQLRTAIASSFASYRVARAAGRTGATEIMTTKRLFFALWPDHRQRDSCATSSTRPKNGRRAGR